jgi:hypothetical protein
MEGQGFDATQAHMPMLWTAQGTASFKPFCPIGCTNMDEYPARA